MQIWDNHKTKDILKSIEQEVAKAQNELACAKGDVNKAQKRMAFALSALHNLHNRDIKE